MTIQGNIMNQEELLDLYLEKLRVLCNEKLEDSNISVIEALKESIVYLEGEMQGY
jgi:hypothetical protein